MDPQQLLQTILPAGEWSNVKVVNADGMMQDRNWAVLATADWQRRGGVPAFIKFIQAAGHSAGPTTLLVTDISRLKQLERRLSEVRTHTEIPLVPILELRMILDKGLLIVMERISILQTLIDENKASSTLAVKLLSTLDHASADVPAWHHFDVCARNIGIRENGAPVFIDVESVYLADRGKIPVTLPAFKPGRLPRKLKLEVLSSAIANGHEIHLPSALALRKFRCEVILAASECCLGPMPVSMDPLGWLDGFAISPVAACFAKALRQIEAGEMVTLQNVASELGKLDPTYLNKALVDSKLPRVEPYPIKIPTQGDSKESQLPISRQNGWEAGFRSLAGQASSLRRGELRKDELLQYRERLESIVQNFPDASPVWEELLLLAISYERSRDRARLIVDRALLANSNDRGFQDWKQILTAWVVD